MNFILREMYAMFSASQQTIRAFRGIGFGLIILGSGGISTALLGIAHDTSHLLLISLILLTSGCIIALLLTQKRKKNDAKNTARFRFMCIAATIAIVLSTTLITGDVRSWILVALTSAIAIMLSYRI